MPKPTKRTDFPKNFLWGASTASHQVEGHTVNQWSVWELAHASQRAKQAERRLGWLPNWAEVKPLATKPDNYVSGNGVDHYRLYEQDFDLLTELNLNSFRFGIEWSRLEPIEGQWDPAAFQHYHDYIAELKKRHIEPVLNLWHWTMPTWFTDKGGFAKRANLVYFNRFAQKVAEEFGRDLSYVLTINEPNVYASLSYVTGEWPPNERNWRQFLWVYMNLVGAHKKAYKYFKRANPKTKVGMAQNTSFAVPQRPGNWLDQLAASVSNYAWNWWFFNRTRHQQDFIGLNFYHVNYMHLWHQVNPETPRNDLGWYMEPSRLYDVLCQAKKYNRPVLVTENGVADAHDQYRQWWLGETMSALKAARRDGVDVRGYFHWSLLDNFEWADGWWPKFGLVEVQRENHQKRIVHKSAKWWSSWLRA